MANFPPYPYGGYQPMQMPQMTTQMPMPQMAPQMPQTGQMSGGGLSPMSRPVSSREEAQATAAEYGIPAVARMPLDPKISTLADVGRIEDYDGSALADIFAQIEKAERKAE